MSAILLAVGGVSEGAKFAPPLYINAIGWRDVLTILVVLGGIILLCGYILSVMYKGKRRLPPDTPIDG